jgi:HAD superfamily hydrolase (TIGR01509 family)
MRGYGHGIIRVIPVGASVTLCHFVQTRRGVIVTELKALLFDVDGTLADTEEMHRQSFNAAFVAAGLDWHWSQQRYSELLAVTGGKERIRHFLEREGIHLAPPQGLDAFIAELHQAKTDHYTHTLGSGGMPLRPGVKRLLLEARQAGLRLAIATTTTPENVTALLVNSLAADSCDWFEVIAAGSMVPRKKPDPGIYLYAMDKMGLAPEACLAFEDSENGLHAALGAGLNTLVTPSDYTLQHDFTGAALLVDSLGEPAAPMRVLAGDAFGRACVDVELLRRLHRG